MKKVKSFATSAVLNIGFVFVVYKSLWGYDLAAWNLLRFWIWFHFCVSTLTAFALGEKYFAENPERAQYPSFPRWLNRLIDFGAVVALAAFGKFLYATLWMLGCFLFEIYLDRMAKFLKAQKP